MAGMALTDDNKDYFRELCLKRQAQRVQRDKIGVGSSTHVVEAVIPIIVVSASESNRPPMNPKKRTKKDHEKDHGRYSRCHGERSSSGKSPRRDHMVWGSSSTDPDFLGHLQVVERVTITLNPYEQGAHLSARPSQIHYAFMELCSQTLVLDKRMASDLMKKDKNVVELDSLRAQLEESTTNLQSALVKTIISWIRIKT